MSDDTYHKKYFNRHKINPIKRHGYEYFFKSNTEKKEQTK